MLSSPLSYLIDPVLRAPTIGSMLMCFASALVGCLVFIRKRSLLGEALSHASYPGVVLSALICAALFPFSEEGFSIGILIGAFLSSFLGLWLIDSMQKRFGVKDDAALCFVLSVFFGCGVLMASRIQITHALWYKQIQVFLYGQAATMTDVHIFIYGILVICILVSLFFFYRPIEVASFDRDFAKSVGVSVRLVDGFLFFLLVLAIVIGIRSVGVVLMSGMLIAPAVAARQFTHRLSFLFGYAAFFGILSGFCGNYLSIELPLWLNAFGWEGKFSLPTGPMILLSAACFAFLSLIFAPESGLLSRFIRIVRFRGECRMENTLKAFWKKGIDKPATFFEISKWQQASLLMTYFLLWRLILQGWVERGERGNYSLTADGKHRASRIIRLHRLWEVYLVYLGQGVEKVHRNAEEMEHIITPEIEKELIELLEDPKQDPHLQPIPAKDRSL